VTQSDEVLGLVEGVLGADVVGAYAHGSAVLGGRARAATSTSSWWAGEQIVDVQCMGAVDGAEPQRVRGWNAG
jgi:hypothetical protein